MLFLYSPLNLNRDILNINRLTMIKIITLVLNVLTYIITRNTARLIKFTILVIMYRSNLHNCNYSKKYCGVNKFYILISP